MAVLNIKEVTGHWNSFQTATLIIFDQRAIRQNRGFNLNADLLDGRDGVSGGGLNSADLRLFLIWPEHRGKRR
jgi:hypothetical protein